MEFRDPDQAPISSRPRCRGSTDHGLWQQQCQNNPEGIFRAMQHFRHQDDL